jgi:hypothetical protein
MTNEIFNEIKSAAIEIWQGYDDTYGYASEKIQRVNAINNVGDEWIEIVGMFDHDNRLKLLSMLPDEAWEIVKEYA